MSGAKDLDDEDSDEDVLEEMWILILFKMILS